MKEAGRVLHALSVDVEDWYHDGLNGRDGLEERVEENTERLLDLFAENGTRATLFFLGAVAERFPALVRRAVAEGHEIGSHGHGHQHVSKLLRREFQQDVQRSLGILEDVAGVPIRGYRAPYFSIKAGVHWPLETLAELGFRYDSSILAIDRPPGLELVCPRRPFRHQSGMWEVPVGVLRLWYWHLPLASGAGLRILPSRLLRRFVDLFEREVGAGVFYLHPWELDPQSPTGEGRGRWILRVGRERLYERLAALLRERSFAPIAEVFREQLDGVG